MRDTGPERPDRRFLAYNTLQAASESQIILRWDAGANNVATEAEIQEEAKKVRRLRVVVDLVISTVQESNLPVEEASELVAATRQFALGLFPDKGRVFDLIYRPRLQRVLAEKYKII